MQQQVTDNEKNEKLYKLNRNKPDSAIEASVFIGHFKSNEQF